MLKGAVYNGMAQALAEWTPPMDTSREVAQTAVRDINIPVAFPVANATGVQQPQKKRDFVVPAAKRPREYVAQYLAEHPAALERLTTDNAYGYRELAVDIGSEYGMDFDHTTVYRAVKKFKAKIGV